MTSDRLKGFVFPVLALLALEAAARITQMKSDSLAAPSEIVVAFGEAVADGSLLQATRDTLVSAFAGLAIGGSIGLLLGIALGMIPVLDRLMEVTVESIRPIPSVAL
ncbi:MAG: transporter permease subunit, partial [Tardiphaga sp.]|nr:transporter permease subunit [Tardiphaga sp.]